MKSIRPLILIAVAFGANVAQAEMCWNEVVPAATLLLPYFEVDFASSSANAVTTLVSVNNASSEAALAHLTFWSNWDQPIIEFHVYLTGYDVATINLRDVFDGKLPITASVGTDPNDTLSPKGPISEDINFPSCANVLPYTNPVIGAVNLERLRDGHTGKPISSLNNRCLGGELGDNIARGYVTIDSVKSCAFEFPSDPGYFVSGGTGIATNDNRLWGDYFIVDPTNNFAFGDNLVHIEARDTFTSASTPTDYTFYGRFTAPSGADNREPLGTTWGVRYLNGGVFDGGTDLIVWRDTTANNQPSQGFVCGVGPNWFPLYESQLFAFDEAEEAVSICWDQTFCVPFPGPDPACFPYATGRYQFGVGELLVPFDFGWAYLNLNQHLDAPTGDVDFGSSGRIAQSYVSANHSAAGRFQVGLQALQLTSACEDLVTVISDTGIETFP